MKYKCMVDGCKIKGCKVDNPELEQWVELVCGEILDCDGEYIIKNGTYLCHKNSIMGKCFFRKDTNG